MKPRKVVRSSDDLPRGHWMKRQLPPGTSLRSYAEDRAVSELVGFAIDAIDVHGMSRKEVADMLGTTKSNVSQFLSGSRNMTIKTLGALLWTCGWQIEGLLFSPLGTEREKRTKLRRRGTKAGGKNA